MDSGFRFTFDLSCQTPPPGMAMVLDHEECNLILESNGFSKLELLCDQGRPVRWLTRDAEGRDVDPRWAIASVIRTNIVKMCLQTSSRDRD